MHKVAYDTVVREMGKRKVYYRGKTGTPMREFLKERLAVWKCKFKDELAKAIESEKRHAKTGLGTEDDELSNALLYSMLLRSSKDDYLRPMSTMRGGA